MKNSVKELCKEVFKPLSNSTVFNFYNSVDEKEDLEEGDKIRQRNLREFLEVQLKLKPKFLWIAEAPSYKGSKRSGVYLISEENFDEVNKKLNINLKKATKAKPKTAYTAKVIWEEIKKLNEMPLTFNIFPFHSHKPNNPYSNRTPTAKEINKNIHFTKELISIFQPQKIIAIGRKAEKALIDNNIPYTYARHPAQGGKTKFVKAIRNLY